MDDASRDAGGVEGHFRERFGLHQLAICVEFRKVRHAGGVAELADALDLGSSSQKECRFDSCRPH